MLADWAPTEALLACVLRQLDDTDDDVRSAAATTLATWGRQHAASRKDIIDKLIQMCARTSPDEAAGRTPEDHAYDALSEIVEESG